MSERIRSQCAVCDLSFEHRAGYLAAFASGEHDSVEISTTFLAEVARECRARGYKRVLIVDDLKQPLSLIDLYTLIRRLPDLGFLGMVMAYVALNPGEQFDYRFAETAGLNAGLLGKMFQDVASAEQWLESAAQTPPS